MKSGLLLLAFVAQSTLAADSLRDELDLKATALYPKLGSFYRTLHANPELSGHEEKTSARLAEELRAAGCEVTEHVGGFGVVALLQNGEGPTLLVRSDMDALPITERTGAPYSSSVTTQDDKGNTVGVMHACGHDMHMTVLAGTATVLQQLTSRWHGTIVFIGQPAEERVAGARAMLRDGLFSRFPKPKQCLALHCAADLPAGSVGITEGYALANVDSVDILVRGVGGHGAWPHKTKDPVVLASQIVVALQTIVSRETDPTQPAVVTVGSIHGGTKYNIIPDEVRLQLTLRSYSDEVRNHTVDAIKRITRGLAEAAGIPPDRFPTVTVAEESSPATYNDPQLSRRLLGVFGDVLGSERVFSTKPIMGAEDFGLLGRTEDKIPVCMFWLGTVCKDMFRANQVSGAPLPALHSSQFLPSPEETFRTGVIAMTAAVLNLLSRQNQ